MDSLNPFKNFNPLSLLGGAAGPGAGGASGIEGADPMQMLASLFGNQGASAKGQEQSQVVSSGGAAEGGACGCGSNCCQKNEELGF